mgnify:CR=1 FL=1
MIDTHTQLNGRDSKTKKVNKNIKKNIFKFKEKNNY